MVTVSCLDFNGAKFRQRSTLNTQLTQTHGCEPQPPNFTTVWDTISIVVLVFVMEGSSNSVYKENIKHTKDDTVKTLHASIENLNSFIRRHTTASFKSLCTVKSFSVQCVCNTITLSTTTMDSNKIGAYIQTEVRSADIPLTFETRSS